MKTDQHRAPETTTSSTHATPSKRRPQVRHLSLRPALRAAHANLVATKAEMSELFTLRSIVASTQGRSSARRAFATDLAELRQLERQQQEIYRNLSDVRRFLRDLRRI